MGDAKRICESEGLSFAKILSEADQQKMRYKLRGFKSANGDPEAAGVYNPVADPNCDSNNDGVGTIDEWPCGMWIGGSDQAREGDWRWTSGQLFSHYNFGGFDHFTQNISGLYPWGNETCSTGVWPCGSDDEPCAARPYLGSPPERLLCAAALPSATVPRRLTGTTMAPGRTACVSISNTPMACGTTCRVTGRAPLSASW